MSPQEFVLWFSFYELEPPNEELRWLIAGMRSDIWNASGNLKKGVRAKPADFMPKPKPKPLSPEESVNLLKEMLGG